MEAKMTRVSSSTSHRLGLFYSAYPEASVREVWKALKTKKAFHVLLDAAN